VALGLVAVWFCLASLAETIPAMCAGQAPSVVADFGTPTYFANAIDLAIALPAFALGIVYLWRRRPFGYVLAGMLLTLVVLVMLSSLSMFHVQVKHGIQVATVDLVAIGSMAVAYLGLLVWYLASTTRKAGRA
jgi:hypothetical protein